MPGWWQSIVLIMIIDCNAWEVGGWWRHAIFDPSKFGKESQGWFRLLPLEMMMSRCQVFAAPWKQEKGWLLYLRSLPQGMTNNSGRPLFPKLSRYKQIVIVKLLNFGQFAAFIWQQKSRHRQQNPSNSEEEFWTFCVTAAIPLKSGLRKHKRMKHGHFFLTEDWHRPEMRVACDMECVSPCYLIVQPCKKLYKGVTRLVKSCIRVWMLARSCIRVWRHKLPPQARCTFIYNRIQGPRLKS